MPKRPSENARSNGHGHTPRLRPPRINWRTRDLTTIDTGGDDSLIRELVTYQRNLDLLLERKGQYVLIKGEEISGYFADLDSALDAAAERFAPAPVLIKKIVESEPIHPIVGIDL